MSYDLCKRFLAHAAAMRGPKRAVSFQNRVAAVICCTAVPVHEVTCLGVASGADVIIVDKYAPATMMDGLESWELLACAV